MERTDPSPELVLLVCCWRRKCFLVPSQVRPIFSYPIHTENFAWFKFHGCPLKQFPSGPLVQSWFRLLKLSACIWGKNIAKRQHLTDLDPTLLAFLCFPHQWIYRRRGPWVRRSENDPQNSLHGIKTRPSPAVTWVMTMLLCKSAWLKDNGQHLVIHAKSFCISIMVCPSLGLLVGRTRFAVIGSTDSPPRGPRLMHKPQPACVFWAKSIPLLFPPKMFSPFGPKCSKSLPSLFSPQKVRPCAFRQRKCTEYFGSSHLSTPRKVDLDLHHFSRMSVWSLLFGEDKLSFSTTKTPPHTCYTLVSSLHSMSTVFIVWFFFTGEARWSCLDTSLFCYMFFSLLRWMPRCNRI